MIEDLIVIVLGMHRSGTSALAGMLHHNGINMGEDEDFYPPPMKENPKGFYENKRFRNINDEILKLADYRVKSFIPDIPVVEDIPRELYLKMAELVWERETSCRVWGWKDPRTCLTIKHWLHVLETQGFSPNTKVIITIRAEKAIRKSMLKRGNKEKHRNQFIKLAKGYYKRCNDIGDMDFMTVEFRKLINNTEGTAKRISNFLRWPIEDLSFIEEDLVNV